MVNSKRPQTSYGGLSARQKSLQKSLRQKSSKVGFGNVGHSKFYNQELFPMPANNINYEVSFKNKLGKK